MADEREQKRELIANLRQSVCKAIVTVIEDCCSPDDETVPSAGGGGAASTATVVEKRTLCIGLESPAGAHSCQIYLCVSFSK